MIFEIRFQMCFWDDFETRRKRVTNRSRALEVQCSLDKANEFLNSTILHACMHEVYLETATKGFYCCQNKYTTSLKYKMPKNGPVWLTKRGMCYCATVSAHIQPHSFQKSCFWVLFLIRTQYFDQKVNFFRDFLNWTSPKNPFWIIEPHGCKWTDTVLYLLLEIK